MAEQYFRGTHRIHYKAAGFQEGVQVQVQFHKPGIGWGEKIDLEELGQGLYVSEINFNIRGTWVGLFFENNKKTVSQNFYIVRASKSGENLLNC